MPKTADYSTTVIYKITCNDSNITDKYVGHTTDLVRRRKEHKTNTFNEKSPQYNIKLYKFIRENGGWDNWKMEVINFYNCRDLSEARQKEQEHYDELNASLNSMEPMNTKETKMEMDIPPRLERMTHKYLCEKCNYICRDKTDLEKHKKTKKHMSSEVKLNYVCERCDYICNNQSIMNKHKNTEKHKMKEALFQKTEKDKMKEVVFQKTESESDSDIMTVVKQLLIQNNDLKNLVIEQANDHKKYTFELLNKLIETFKPLILQL
jgi:hypothetical protein